MHKRASSTIKTIFAMKSPCFLPADYAEELFTLIVFAGHWFLGFERLKGFLGSTF
jgi:hypothetical protein